MKHQHESGRNFPELENLQFVENLSAEQLLDRYRFFIKLYNLINSEEALDFVTRIQLVYAKLEQINLAYNCVVGREVDLWSRFKNITC